MEYLYLIGIIVLVIAVIVLIIWGLFYLLPVILVVFVAAYIYNRFFRSSKEEPDYTDYINENEDIFDSYTTSHAPGNDVIDVEYTERDDEE